MTRRVARRGDDLERADPVAGADPLDRSIERFLRVSAAQLAGFLTRIERTIASQEARIAIRDEHLDPWQLLRELLGRADVIHVDVGQGDPHDRLAERGRPREDRLARLRRHRVDHRQTVDLLDQVAVDQSRPRDADHFATTKLTFVFSGYAFLGFSDCDITRPLLTFFDFANVILPTL